MGRWGTEPGGAVMFRGLGQEGTPPPPLLTGRRGLQSPPVFHARGLGRAKGAVNPDLL